MNIGFNFRCNESWESMETHDSGRFCGKCSKNVFDLTNKSNEEIEELYRQNNGEMCGRLSNNQLLPRMNKRKLGLAQFCLALFMVFGSMLFTYDVNAQTIQSKNRGYLGDIASDSLQKDYRLKLGFSEKVVELGAENETDIESSVSDELKVIQGRVTDKETGEELAFVNVSIKIGPKLYNCVTDFEGRYKMAIPVSNGKRSIHFSYVGYTATKIENLVFDAGKDVLRINVDMQMEAQHFEMGMVIIERRPSPIIRDPEQQGVTEFNAEEIRRSPY